LIDNRFRRLIIRPQILADRLPLNPRSHVLEVGPGSGYFSVELAARVPDGALHLFDLHPEMLAKAAAKFGPEPPPNLSATAGDAGAPWPFADGSFNLVLMVAVLGELGGAGPPLRSAFRTLSPSGTLAIHEHWPDPDFHRLGPLRQLVEAEGFQLAASFGSRLNYTALFRKRAT
jgi:ubiquinone/menaquinone biosynthesis C-methylase UbiE